MNLRIKESVGVGVQSGVYLFLSTEGFQGWDRWIRFRAEQGFYNNNSSYVIVVMYAYVFFCTILCQNASFAWLAGVLSCELQKFLQQLQQMFFFTLAFYNSTKLQFSAILQRCRSYIICCVYYDYFDVNQLVLYGQLYDGWNFEIFSRVNHKYRKILILTQNRYLFC
eukprot:TRINITY_DN1082_c2_g1_i1.p4 TRINITY_DN1082_c2_g1~~TRINITY_DN1082_c2_g1_i1.p4  ORF type:complete len:167 (+),score=6.19 TRINITY_DN1082_c2_g1_i1:50-550(+)